MGDIMSVELTRRESDLVRFHRNEPIDMQGTMGLLSV